MINFKTYLIEQEEPQGKPLTHLRHVDDNVLYGGHQGVGLAAQHLEDVHNKLLGKNNSTTVTTKYDGAPSIVFGQHPKTGQFFVATKGAFNKTPKLAFSHDDIDKHFGHAPGLAAKMHAAFDHLSKIMPRNGGVYQGDLMHTPEDVVRKKGNLSFRANTLEHSVPEDSAMGQAVKNSKLGVVVHTQYKGRGDLDSMSATPLSPKQRGRFEQHPDVNNIDPTINVNPANYTPEEQKAYLNHMENAKRSYASMKPEAMDALEGHGEMLERHVNDMIKKGGAPSVEGYMDYLTAAHQKDISKLKSQAAIDKRIQAHAANLQQIAANRDHFKKALELHGHLQAAKNVLTGVMAKNSPFAYSINGEATGPEGAVAVDKDGNMSKFVDRAEFSRQNFLGGKFRAQQAQAQQQQQQPVEAESGPAQEAPPPSGHGVTLGGFDPVTHGHELLFNAMSNGNHETTSIYTTKTPRSKAKPDQKVDFISQATGRQHHVASTENGFNALTDLYNRLSENGKKEVKGPVVFYHGPEESRANLAQQFQNYNGVSTDKNGKPLRHGYYNFPDGIVGQQVGDENTRSAVSGTKARASKSPQELANYLPDRLKPRSQEVFNAINGIQEGYVPNEGNAATVADLSARGAAQEESGPLKKKKLKENTTGSVGGLGFNTGNPAAGEGSVQQYQDTNGTLAKDDENGNLIKNHNDLHAPLGFKAFDPSKDLKQAKGKK